MSIPPRDVANVDVFPREGLQTLPRGPHLRAPSTEEKVAIIEWLDWAGVPEIEITGFVHPHVIPSLADADEVARAVLARPHIATYKALVPNARGAERAMAAGVPKLVCLIIASETYPRLNANATVERNLEEIATIAHEATSAAALPCRSIRRQWAKSPLRAWSTSSGRAARTSTVWSIPVRLKLFSSASTP